MVVADVDGAEIPVFIDEEVEYVDCVEDYGNNHGLGDEAMELILVGHEGEITEMMSV
jgi:hypothetical protein